MLNIHEKPIEGKVGENSGKYIKNWYFSEKFAIKIIIYNNEQVIEEL